MTASVPSSESAARGPAPVPLLPGIAPLAERYDGFILDLWGVVHDGIAAYPGVTDALARLKVLGKRVLLLSNAPRRVEAIARAMERMGIARALYDELVSSGEAAYQALRRRDDAWLQALGRTCYLMGPARDRGMVEGLDLARVARIEEASFILATGVDWDDDGLELYEPALAAGAAQHLPMVCANPDLVVIRGGKRVICAGALARRYEELGGPVRYFGKPHAPIYWLCLERLGIADRARIVAVGDSLRTDIAGARAAGLDAVLVVGGIHAEELGIASGAEPDPQALAAACARAGEHPVAAIPAFVW